MCVCVYIYGIYIYIYIYIHTHTHTHTYIHVYIYIYIYILYILNIWLVLNSFKLIHIIYKLNYILISVGTDLSCITSKNVTPKRNSKSINFCKKQHFNFSIIFLSILYRTLTLNKVKSNSNIIHMLSWTNSLALHLIVFERSQSLSLADAGRDSPQTPYINLSLIQVQFDLSIESRL